MEFQDIYQKLISLLNETNARYRVVEHAPEGQTELVSHMRGNLLSQAVKSLVVLVKVGKKESRYYLVNIPGDRRADLNAVKALCSGTHVMFAPAEKARELTGCEMGAVPPFSFNAQLTLVLDPALLEHEELVFNAGRLDRSIFLHKDDYLKIAKPVLTQIS
ncbi:MAG: YbaK/prolyl-tRNA synthetase associated domain-containing protein [Anaerolineales bacterium]|nr:YbaK/prolyl-tRNA synthetase associated domain-containing protein [Anaerolineales bacterium]